MECYPSFQAPPVCEDRHASTTELDISVPDTTILFLPETSEVISTAVAEIIPPVTATPYLPATGMGEGIFISAIFCVLLGLFMTTLRRK